MSETSDSARWFSTKSPDRVWDAVVIGSGMGGMTCAAILAHLGQRVLVLEQHYVPGGFTHRFKRKRWSWDVGVHAVGEVDPRALLGRLLVALTAGELSWASLGEVYDAFHFPDLRIDFPNDRRQFIENLCAAFPDERGTVEGYLSRAREVSSAMRGYYLSRLMPPAWAPITDRLVAGDAHRMLTQTTRDVLGRLTRNERLASVLTAQWGYYGAPPDRSSFAIHALVARHFLNGGFYPDGGAGRIAEALLGRVAHAGGWTRIRAEVDKIIVRDGRAEGVKLVSGEQIRARRVISAAGALNTVRSLLPPEVRAMSWAREIDTLRPSPCHVCLYLGFKGDIRAAGASAANQWFYETWSPDATMWNIGDPQADAPVLYCSFPSLKDPHHDPGPEQLHTGEVVTFVPYETFAPYRDGRWMRRGDEYERIKDGLAERLKTQFLRHMPALAPYIAYAELSTPLSTEHFTRASSGAIYGIEPTPERYRARSLRPRTAIRGLFLTGSDVASVGVMGAMVGGVLTAVATEPARVLPFLRRSVARV